QVGAGQLGDGVGREAGGAQGSHSRKGSRLVCKGNSPSGRQRRLYNGVQIPANAHQRELNNMGHHCTTTGFRWRGQPGPNNDQGGCSSQHGYWQSKTNNQGARCTKWKLPVGHGGCPKPEAANDLCHSSQQQGGALQRGEKTTGR
ncbi:hypothetical protein Ocin01_17395, partial [Orchesella cincta]